MTGVAAAALGLTAAGCGESTSSSAGSGASSSPGKAAGTLEGNGEQIVFFSLPRAASPYIGTLVDGVKSQAAELGYKVKVIETTFDQSVQNQQAQQYIASGQKPAAFLWWPFVGPSGVNATRALSRVAPVIQINTFPQTAGDRRFIKAYVGVSDVALGALAGKMLMEARDKFKQAGAKLHSDGGNVVYFNAPAGSTSGVDRLKGFKEATKDAPFNVIGDEKSQLTPEDTFKVANQVLPKYKRKGLDFVFVFNTFGGLGLLKAMDQQGIKPGLKPGQVPIVAANCSGDANTVADGQIYGLGLQSAQIEGLMGVRTIAQYLATGKVTPGDVTDPPSPDAVPELKVEAPHENTFLPLAPAVGPEGLKSAKLWGLGSEQICPPAK